MEEIERQQREQIRVPDSGGQGQSQGGLSQSPSTRELLNLIAAAAAGDGQGGTLPAMPQVSASLLLAPFSGGGGGDHAPGESMGVFQWGWGGVTLPVMLQVREHESIPGWVGVTLPVML